MVKNGGVRQGANQAIHERGNKTYSSCANRQIGKSVGDYSSNQAAKEVSGYVLQRRQGGTASRGF